MQAQVNVNGDLAKFLKISESNTSGEVNQAVKSFIYTSAKLMVPDSRGSTDPELARAEYDYLSKVFAKRGKLSSVDSSTLSRRARALRLPDPQVKG